MPENNFSSQDQNVNASLEVNFDALSAPEGSYDPFIHGNGDGNGAEGGEQQERIPGSTDELINGLPNLDLQFNQENQNQNQNENQDNNLENQNNNNQQNQDQSNQNQSQSTDQYWMKPFEQLKAANPEWNIPEGINEENYLGYLQEIFKPEIHPEIAKMQKALDSGLEFEKVIESYSSNNDPLKLSDRDLMAKKFKDSYKDWSEEKVTETLNKLEQSGLLEIEASRYRNEVSENQKHSLDKMQKEFEKTRIAEEVKINEERSKQINDSLKFINNANDIYGLPISQAEKAEFGEYFAKLVTPDNTGIAPMFQMLQSNETLVKVAAMMWKGDAKIKAALSNAKEDGKNSVLDKLNPNPSTVSRNGGNQDPTQIDFDALSAPERLTL